METKKDNADAWGFVYLVTVCITLYGLVIAFVGCTESCERVKLERIQLMKQLMKQEK